MEVGVMRMLMAGNRDNDGWIEVNVERHDVVADEEGEKEELKLALKEEVKPKVKTEVKTELKMEDHGEYVKIPVIEIKGEAPKRKRRRKLNW